MPYFAAVFARSGDAWTGQELDLDGVGDVDELADLVRDASGDADVGLLFVEEDDEYAAVVRVDPGQAERVFVSDGRAAHRYPILALLADAVSADAGTDRRGSSAAGTDDDEPPVASDFDPLGDADVLADLGTPGRALLALCAHEGTLPADVITEVCERAGCLDELEVLRVT